MNYKISGLRNHHMHSRTGGMLVFVALIFVVFLIFAALSVDVANMHMVKAELRTATDAAARAGAEAMARTQDSTLATNAAIAIAAQNKVGGKSFTLEPGDILLGHSSPDGNGQFIFNEGATPFNSVRILAERSENSPDGAVPLFLAGVFGRGTFSPKETATATSTVRDIALVLDRSGSMGESIGSETRLDALKTAVNLFLDDIEIVSPGAKVSLTSYSTSASKDIQLTTNFGSIVSEVGDYEPGEMTNISQGLQFGSESLENDPGRRPHADRVIVLMTDGNFNEGGTPIPSAEAAAALGHQIHTITFSSEADITTMQEVAAIGNGLHVHADDNDGLADAFREIARTLTVLLTE